MGLAGAIIVVLAALLLLFGCVHVVKEPGLPWPERPTVHFFRCGPEDVWVCMTEPEANGLLRYIQKLNEFEAARERLLKD